MVRWFAPLFIFGSLFLSGNVSAQEGIVLEKPSADKPKDSISYAMGWSIGMNMAGAGFRDADLALEDFIAGIRSALKKEKCKLNEDEMMGAMQSLDARMVKRAQEVAKSNADEAAKFLEENKKKDGVQVTQSGLQYKALKNGTGAKASLTSTVKVHYEGKLIDGTIFDSSLQRGQPAEFKLQGVIPGWIEALQRMKVGDKWQLFIPPALAYGERGQGGDIGPNQLLIFEVELLEVK